MEKILIIETITVQYQNLQKSFLRTICQKYMIYCNNNIFILSIKNITSYLTGNIQKEMTFFTSGLYISIIRNKMFVIVHN